MATIIAIINREDPIEKSLTSVNLAACLARAGQKTLLVDMDPQAHTTLSYDISPKECEASNTYHVLMGLSAIQDVLCPTQIPNLSLIPSHLHLTQVEIELVNITSRELKLREILSAIQEDYAFIIADCPSSLGLLSLNALVAAKSVLIPIPSESHYSTKASDKLFNTLQFIQRHLNPHVQVAGVLFITPHALFPSVRSIDGIDHIVGDKVPPRFPHKMCETVINGLDEDIGSSCLLVDRHSPIGQSYMQLAQEIILGIDPGL